MPHSFEELIPGFHESAACTELVVEHYDFMYYFRPERFQLLAQL